MSNQISSYKAVEDLEVIVKAAMQVSNILKEIEDKTGTDYKMPISDTVQLYAKETLDMFSESARRIIYIGACIYLKTLIDSKNNLIDSPRFSPEDKNSQMEAYDRHIFKMQDFIEYHDTKFTFTTLTIQNTRKQASY